MVTIIGITTIRSIAAKVTITVIVVHITITVIVIAVVPIAFTTILIFSSNITCSIASVARDRPNRPNMRRQPANQAGATGHPTGGNRPARRGQPGH